MFTRALIRGRCLTAGDFYIELCGKARRTCVPLSVLSLTDPGEIASQYRAGAASAGEAVHRRHVLGVRQQPALDGRAHLEEHP